MKRLLKYLALFFVALVVLLAGALLVAETRWAKDRLRDLLVDAAGESLTADIRIGRIEGDLFHSIVVRDVLLSSHGDTLVSVPSLEVRYHPVGLLGRKIQIESVVIESPTVHARQLPDSTWDLAGLVRPSGKPSATSSGPMGGWEVSVGELVLRSGRVLLSPLGERPELPRLIEKLELHAAFAASDTIQSAHLTSLAFSTGGPSLRVERIAGKATLTPRSLEVTGFELRTAQNSLQVDGAYSLVNKREVEAGPQNLSACRPGILRIRSGHRHRRAAGRGASCGDGEQPAHVRRGSS